MAALSYTEVPSLDRWKKDSSVALAVRNKDIILSRIDQLVDEYQKAGPRITDNGLILCDIFLTTNFWVKSLESGNRLCEKSRYQAIMALFTVVVAKLKKVFEVSSEVAVSNEMKDMFGVGMSRHGYEADSMFGAITFDKAQLAKFRIWFKHGLAYQIPWWTSSGSLKRVLAESKYGYVAIGRPGGGQAQFNDYSGFIMTVERELYMTKHDFDSNKTSGNTFHSSYLGWTSRVAMAGTILIEDGRIRGVRTDSGHYQPGLHNLNAFLWALRMYGVPLDSVELFDYKGDSKGSAATFLASQKRWEVYFPGQKAERGKLAAAKPLREQFTRDMNRKLNAPP